MTKILTQRLLEQINAKKKVGHTKIEVGIHMFLLLPRRIFYNIRECTPYPGT